MRSFRFMSVIGKCHGVKAGFAILVAGAILFPSGVCWADHVFSLDNSRVRRNSYPVTELKMVHEPGNFHYVRTYDGSHVLTDYWWKEVTVGHRTYEPPRYPQQPQYPPPHNPYPQPGPQYPDYPTHHGPKGKIFVEIVKGKGYEFFQKERIKPISFTLFEDVPRQVTIRFGNSRKTVTAIYDGYHVDLGLEEPAKVLPEYNGVVQDLGDGQGLENVDVALYWERDKRGGVRVYKEGAAKSSAEGSDVWGAQIKQKVLSQKGVGGSTERSATGSSGQAQE